jgi:hypothetical protein
MPVVIPPTRRSLVAQLARMLIVLAAIAGIVVFLWYRFGETPIERADRLFHKRDFAALQKLSRKQIEKGERNPLFFSYDAVSTFATDSRTPLAALLERVSAADNRAIFRRETLVRIVEINAAPKRAGEILTEALKVEKPPGAELRNLIQELVKSSLALAGAESAFAELAQLFSKDVRQVSAKRLQMRSAPSTDASVVRQLEDGETLLVRTANAPTNVSGRNGKWTLVLDRNMESGWVFDAYLKQPEN